MRGKPAKIEPGRALVGITPACAGKTGFLVVAAHGSKDHPRVCGENKCNGKLPYRDLGSPPRVRGKLDEKPYGEFKFRITPACAGKTDREQVL